MKVSLLSLKQLRWQNVVDLVTSSASATSQARNLAVRVIACLDVKQGRVVKGRNFVDLKDAGDPVELALKYYRDGVDEITFLDIAASSEERATTFDLVRRTAESIFIPLTVGGGITSLKDVDLLLRSGADKVSVNTAAIMRPELIDEIARDFGSQVLVISIDARRASHMPSGFEVTTHGGTRSAGKDAVSWVREAIDRGVGEVLLNSMDRDGTQGGFDLELIRLMREGSSVPLIASGGAGALTDFSDAVGRGADAVLAASVFHYDSISISQVKSHLAEKGFTVRRSHDS